MESFLDCNFPELLAVDLETSGQISRPTSWTPKLSKTAVAAERKKALVLEELSLGAITSPREKELLSKMKSLEILEMKYSQLLALGEELMRESSDSDMSSSDSFGGVEPPSIRKRKLSITTPATSITSGRKCSPSAQTSPSTSPQNQIPLASWLDSEEESPDTQQRKHNRMAREDHYPTASSPRQTPARYDSRADSLRAPRRVPESHAPDPFANFGDSMDDEDDVSSRNRPSFSRSNNHGNNNLRVPGYRDRTSYGRRGHESPQSLPSRNCFVPSTKIIDETSTGLQPQLSRGRKKQFSIVPQHREYGDIAEDIETQDSQSIICEGPFESSPLTHSNEPMQQHESVETWFETVIDDFSHPFESDLETPTTKLPLSADVLETLRVSVSCFPETMLLCSSLSIETIRSNTRKVKYESKCALDLCPVSQPVQHDGKRTKASNWRRFTSIARKNHTETASNTPTLAPTNFGREEKATWPDSSPVWASIKSIFPNGTDYLCDALYAHILTYNYIDSLCPRMLIPAAPQPSRPQTARKSMDNTSSPGRQSSSNACIPRKAASILGLQYSIPEDVSSNPSMPRTSSQSSRSRHPSMSSSTASRSKTTNTAIGKSNNILRKKNSCVNSKNLGVESGCMYPELSRQQQPEPVTSTGLRGRRSLNSGHKSNTGVNGAAGNPPVPRVSSAEQNLVDLRNGLSTCITRLIATLKMTSYNENAARDEGNLTVLAGDGHGAENGYKGFGCNGVSVKQNGGSAGGGSNSNAVDVFLVRSLCELVRVSEGSGRSGRH